MNAMWPILSKISLAGAVLRCSLRTTGALRIVATLVHCEDMRGVGAVIAALFATRCLAFKSASQWHGGVQSADTDMVRAGSVCSFAKFRVSAASGSEIDP